MKLPRTKAQEIVNSLYGYGRYIVKEKDIDLLAEYFERIFSSLLEGNYCHALLKYVRGVELSQYESQLKFHALPNLRVAVRVHETDRPDFLEKVEYDPEKHWALSDLGEVLYGVRGDPKVYHLNLPQPLEGRTYTTEEVLEIVRNLNLEG